MSQNAIISSVAAFGICVALAGISGCQSNPPRTAEPAVKVTETPKKVDPVANAPRPVTHILTVRAKELTGLNAFSLENSLAEARRRGTTTMIVDVHAVTYVAERGMAALETGPKLFGRENFALVNLSDELREYLDANVAEQFQTFESSDAAIAELRYTAIPVAAGSDAAPPVAPPGTPATPATEVAQGVAEQGEASTPTVSAADNRIVLHRRSEEERVRAKQRARTRTVSQGAAFIGILGAIAGAGLSSDRAQGALIGGSLGALAGTVAGSYIADKQEQYGDELDLLESMISDVRAAQTRLVGDIDLIELVIEDQRREITNLQTDLAAQRITQQQYQDQLASLEKDREQVRAIAESSRVELAKFEKASVIYQEENPSVNSAALNNEIGTYGTTIEELDALTSHLDSLSRAV